MRARDRRRRPAGHLRRGRHDPALLALLVVLFGAQPALAAGIRHVADGWLLGPGATARFLAGAERGESATGSWLSAGQSRLHGLADLPLRALVLGVRPGRRPLVPAVELGWEVLSGGLFRTEHRRLTLSWGRATGGGVVAQEVREQTGGAAGFAVQQRSWRRVDCMLHAQRSLAGVVVSTRVSWPVFADEGAREIPRREMVRLGLRRDGWAVTAGIDQTALGVPTAGLEAWLGAHGAAWGLRADLATGAIGPLLAWRRGALLVRTSHLVHPQLGVTHRVEVGFGRWEAAPW